MLVAVVEKFLTTEGPAAACSTAFPLSDIDPVKGEVSSFQPRHQEVGIKAAEYPGSNASADRTINPFENQS